MKYYTYLAKYNYRVFYIKNNVLCVDKRCFENNEKDTYHRSLSCTFLFVIKVTWESTKINPKKNQKVY